MKHKNIIKKTGLLILYSILTSLLFCGALYAEEEPAYKILTKYPESPDKLQHGMLLKQPSCGGGKLNDKDSAFEAGGQNNKRPCPDGCKKEKISLKVAVEIAMTSPRIKAVRAALKAARFQTDAAKSKRLPTVDIYSDTGYQRADNLNSRNNAGLSYNSQRKTTDIRNGFQIKLIQPLFDGYNAKYNIAAQNNNVKAYEYELMRIKEYIALETTRSYISIVFANKFYTATTMLFLKYRELIGRALNLYKAGKIERVYFREIQELYNVVVEKEATLLLECNKADAEFKRVVGVKPTKTSLFKEPEEPAACPKKKRGIYSLLLANNPELLACKAYEKAAIQNVKAAQSSFMPNINLELSKTWFKNADGSETTEDNELALITLNYNLFNGGGDKALKNKAKELKKKARYQKESLISMIESKADLFFIKLLSASKKKKSLADLEEAQVKLITSYQEKDNFVEVMNVEGRALKTKIELLKAQKEYLITQYEILAESGELVKFFDLK
jgi:adhesin transport system outer membrane protein